MKNKLKDLKLNIYYEYKKLDFKFLNNQSSKTNKNNIKKFIIKNPLDKLRESDSTNENESQNNVVKIKHKNKFKIKTRAKNEIFNSENKEKASNINFNFTFNFKESI